MRKIAFPISLIYALVVYIRNFFYDIGFFKSTSFETPTICIGNLSVGGTGKTPMIEFLVSQLKDTYKIAVLSRGYKRRSSGFILANEKSSVEDLGDEPMQIHLKFPDISVAVDVDRVNGIKHLEEKVQPEIILLDDAYQHRKAEPTFSILLTTYDNPYYRDWYLPTGNLRDSKKEARRANLIVVTKCPSDLTRAQRTQIMKKINPQNHQKVLFSTLVYETELKGADTLRLTDLKNTSITLVTGIAKPKPLIDFLAKTGIRFDHLAFADHHYFTNSEIALLQTKSLILTTEKDYMRLKNKVKNLYYIPVRHDFLGDDLEVIMGAINGL